MDVIQITTEPASGSAGSATATAFSPMLSGLVYKVVLRYGGSPPATTNVKLSDSNDPANESIVNVTGNAEIVLYPRRAMTNSAGTNLTFNGTQIVPTPYPLHGSLRLSLSASNPGVTVSATVYLLRG
ncbi:MAG: hypothetical protein NZ840_11645 [Anaerolineales bacterium]|nr:hypothetical protein [Anaerolineales bacterium]MDW8162688.1 hypothetical protein [Anaerolineales bacterium]